jgi:hypothetical protein
MKTPEACHSERSEVWPKAGMTFIWIFAQPWQWSIQWILHFVQNDKRV